MSEICFTVHNGDSVDDALLHKIIDGTRLLSRIIEDPQFERWVLNFQWQTNDGQLFRQFYYSCGRSNTQVLNSLRRGLSWENVEAVYDGQHRTIKIFPCQSVADYNQIHGEEDTIGLDLRYANKLHYTPIHIAAALCQEYCISLGYPPSGKVLEECWSKFTVPVAMARILRDVVVILAKEDEHLMEWCMQNADFQFDYQPCSFTFGIQKIGHDIYSNNNYLTKDESISQETHGNNILTSLPN